MTCTVCIRVVNNTVKKNVDTFCCVIYTFNFATDCHVVIRPLPSMITPVTTVIVTTLSVATTQLNSGIKIIVFSYHETLIKSTV